jgi:arylsulfatase A-like enzyme
VRLLYIDIDSLRLDHLGCYGYLRNTSPNIDQLAHESVRFTNDYVSDVPCLPSRTALWSGRQENWFLHVNLWDPHTPFRTPAAFGNPFAGEPLPDWFSEEMWQRAWNGFGPHSPQEPNWLWGKVNARFPRQLDAIDSMEAVRQWVDGYDTGIRYADEWLGKIITKLKEMGIYDETIIVISADHGENIGELNVWGDHQTADHITCNVPLIIRYPGLSQTARVDTALHYHFDWAATVIELLGGTVPGNWDGVSFAAALRQGKQAGRDFVVTSQGAWACQCGVRFAHDGRDYLCLRTYTSSVSTPPDEPIMPNVWPKSIPRKFNGLMSLAYF